MCGAMVLALLKYLFDTYSHSSIVVALLSSLLVITTLAIPCLMHRRRCARNAQLSSMQIPSEA